MHYTLVQLTDYPSISLNSGSPRPPRIRPRPRPSRRVWNYRRLGTYRVPRGRSSPGRRYLGTVKPRINPTKQCALMARKKRYRFFGVRSRRYCYGASIRIPLTRFGRTTGLSGMPVYKIGRGQFKIPETHVQMLLYVTRCSSNFILIEFASFPGPLRPRPRVAVWHYRYVGRFKSLTPKRLGRFVGKMRGTKKVFRCARTARKMGFRAFALRNRGDCYVSRYSSTYSTKKRLFGRFRGSSGTSRAIDAYVIGKGRTDEEWQRARISVN